MPGFTIHIAIAKEYAKKNKGEVQDLEDFIKGTIAPDYIALTDPEKNKDITHYGKWGDWTSYSQEICFDRFLEDPKVNLYSDYWKGYLLHLMVDYYFGKQYFVEESLKAKENEDSFYHDYDCLNKQLLEKYNIEIMEEIKKYMHCIEEEPRYLKLDKVIKFIEDMSNLDAGKSLIRILL